MMDRVTVSAVTGAEPLTVDEAKQHLRVTHSYDDEYIRDLIPTARETLERLTGRTIVQQDLVLVLDFFPASGDVWWDGVREGALTQFYPRFISLARPALISVNEVATYSLENVRSVFDPVNYFVDKSDPNQLARVILNAGCIWPVNLRATAAVEVVMTCGYANDTVPRAIKQALRMLVAYLYEHRGGDVETAATECGAMAWVRHYVFRKPAIASARDNRRTGFGL